MRLGYVIDWKVYTKLKVDLKNGYISYVDGLPRNRIIHGCHSIIRGKGVLLTFVVHSFFYV
jgi:hypothetical protein